MLSWLSNKLYAAGAILILFLAALSEIFRRRGNHWKEKAKQREAALRRKAEIEEADLEIDSEYSELAARSKEDRDNGKVPSHLSDPDDF